MEFKFDNAEKMNGALISLLVKNLAATRAMTDLVIDQLSKSDQEADELTKLINEQKHKYEKRILDQLFEEYGCIDIPGILESSG